MIFLVFMTPLVSKAQDSPVEPIQPAVSIPTLPSNTTWGYQAPVGPSLWGTILGDETCLTGTYQSPIAIETGKSRNGGLKNVMFDSSPFGQLNPLWGASSFNIINNGHTVVMVYDPGHLLEIDGVFYQLAQFHFHSPSEHSIDERHSPLEIHFVHTPVDTTKPLNLVVLSVRVKAGNYNPALEQIWTHIPQNQSATPVPVSGLIVHAANFLPQSLEYFVYGGSLTTPPCTEDVTWFIFHKPIEAAPEQLSILQKTLGGPNNRSIQPLNGRTILSSASASSL